MSTERSHARVPRRTEDAKSPARANYAQALPAMSSSNAAFHPRT